MTDRINKPQKPSDRRPPNSLDKLAKCSREHMEKYGPMHALLDESGKVVPCSLLEWAMWFEKSGQRIIQQDHIEDHFVSTVFEGIANNYPGAQQWWFETMAFGPQKMKDFFGKQRLMRDSLWTERVATLEEALEAHKKGIEFIKQHLEKVKHDLGI